MHLDSKLCHQSHFQAFWKLAPAPVRCTYVCMHADRVHEHQPLTTITGRSRTHFLEMPTAWQVSMTCSSTRRQTERYQLNNVDQCTRIADGRISCQAQPLTAERVGM
jgi:hypothetical protein